MQPRFFRLGRPVVTGFTLLLADFLAVSTYAALPANTDESKVPPYVLPDPLRLKDGSRIARASTWKQRQRPELIEQFSREMYGRTPVAAGPLGVHAEVTDNDPQALEGRAVRKQITLTFTRASKSAVLHVLLYVPKAASTPPPVFLGLNFFGNHTVDADPGIALTTAEPSALDPARTDASPAPARPQDLRGSQASKWLVRQVIERGYATATVWCGDICPDRPSGLEEAVPALFSTGGVETRPIDAWGAVGAWAWGLSRVLDFLETEKSVDARRTILHGFSRLGKAALWAGAQDERFAMVISNESGCGGAALSKRLYGETVAIINEKFPHWFARQFRRYNDQEAQLPFDQHQLLALIAPRPLYVASAQEDTWSDPRGEFLALKAAEPVYELFEKNVVSVAAMPPVNAPVGDVLAYHNRTGRHDMTAYDWNQYLSFADRHARGSR